jgi:hypothetical protein
LYPIRQVMEGFPPVIRGVTVEDAGMLFIGRRRPCETYPKLMLVGYRLLMDG